MGQKNNNNNNVININGNTLDNALIIKRTRMVSIQLHAMSDF